jgi:hypothetical protein
MGCYTHGLLYPYAAIRDKGVASHRYTSIQNSLKKKWGDAYPTCPLCAILYKKTDAVNRKNKLRSFLVFSS